VPGSALWGAKLRFQLQITRFLQSDRVYEPYAVAADVVRHVHRLIRTGLGRPPPENVLSSRQEPEVASRGVRHGDRHRAAP
jgi:hypothetical protein